MLKSIYSRIFFLCTIILLFASALTGLIIVLYANHLHEEEAYSSIDRTARIIMMRMKELYKDNEDVQNLMSIKGIAIQTAATIYTVVDNIERFETPESLVSYVGLKITRHESGGNRDLHGHINKRGDPLVRKYLANVVVKHQMYYPDSDLAKFYSRKKEEMPHWKAVTAAMRKLVCIIWAMLTRHQVYKFKPAVRSS